MKRILFILASFTLILSACKSNISRNSDGSFLAETAITQAQLQEVITNAIADPLIQGITVTFHSGYITVTGDRQRLNDASKVDTLSFRLDLGVNNGELTASISNAQIDGIPIEQIRVDNWNQTIANRLTRLSGKIEGAELQSVSITPAQVTMFWKVQR